MANDVKYTNTISTFVLIKNFLLFNKQGIKNVSMDKTRTNLALIILVVMVWFESLLVGSMYAIKKELVYLEPGRLADITLYFKNINTLGINLALMIDTGLFVALSACGIPLGLLVVIRIYNIRIEYSKLLRITVFSYIPLIMPIGIDFIEEIVLSSKIQNSSIPMAFNIAGFIFFAWFISLLSYSIAEELNKSKLSSLFISFVGFLVGTVAVGIVLIGILASLAIPFEIMFPLTAL